MPNAKTCLVCNKPLVNKRPHAVTCSAYCRLKLHRMNKAKPASVSVKIIFSEIQFTLLKEQADDVGLLVNQLIIERSIKPSNTLGV